MSTMDVATFAEIRKDLKGILDRAVDNREPVVVARKNGKSVVVISLEEYNSMAETLHLIDSPENARRLMRSITQLSERG